MLDDAATREEYDIALTGYELLLFHAGERYSAVKYTIAILYRKKGNYQKAVGILEEVIEEERRKGSCFSDAYVTLINLLRQLEKKEAAREYANELVECSLKALQEKDDASDISYIVYGYHQLYVLEENQLRKESIWQMCLEYFARLDIGEPLNWIVHFFLVEYADRECKDDEKVRVALKYADCMGWTDKDGLYAVNFILGYTQEICIRGEVASEEKITVLLMYAKYLQKKSEPEKAIECCETAMNLLGEKCTEDAYLKSKIYQRLRDIYAEYQMGSEDYLNTLRSRCNYYLIAERESRGKTTEEQCDLWANAAFEYSMLGDVEKETACWKNFAELIGCLEEFNEKSYRVYRSESNGFWDNYVKQTEPEKTKALVSNVYSKLLLFVQRGAFEEVEPSLETELWEMAHALGNSDVLLEEAVVLSMISAYVAVVTEPDWKVMLSVVDNTKAVPEEIIGAIREVLLGTLTSEQINGLINIIDLVDELLKKKDGFDEVKEIVKLYAKRFSEKEWEFKGENW